MYMSLFGCRCKQPLIKPDQAQMKQRWSRTKTTTYQQNIEDDKWGQHVEQGGGPTPQSVGRPTYTWWDPTWPTLPPTSASSRRLVGPTWKQGSIDRLGMWAHLESVHSHRHPHDEHVMEIPNHWSYGGSKVGLIQRWRRRSTRIADVALE